MSTPAPDNRCVEVRTTDVRLGRWRFELRTPTDDEWPAICHFDGRTFGGTYTTEEIEQKRPMHDMGRFRIAVDGKQIVGVAGSYAMDATLPGARIVPMGGVTWVGVAVTHRRQGSDAPVDRCRPRRHRRAWRTARHAVRLGGRDLRPRRLRRRYAGAGDVHRSAFDQAPRPVRAGVRRRCATSKATRSFPRSNESGTASGSCEPVRPAARGVTTSISSPAERGDGRILRSGLSRASRRLRRVPHEDGMERRTSIAHQVSVKEVAAVTPDAHAALWHTLLSLDLVGTITSRVIPIDDPLPMLLENPRSLRTTNLNDGVWLNVRDVAGVLRRADLSHRRADRGRGRRCPVGDRRWT